MRAAPVTRLNTQSLSPDMKASIERTQRFLRLTFRKILAKECGVQISEQSLYIEDPHIYATWSSQSCLLGAGLKIGARIQFDTGDGRLLQALQEPETLPAADESVVRRMQAYADAINEELQRHCQKAGLITGISQASITKAFTRNQAPAYQIRGGAIDSWLLRIGDCSLYCTTHVVFDESRDIVVLGQSLPS